MKPKNRADSRRFAPFGEVGGNEERGLLDNAAACRQYRWLTMNLAELGERFYPSVLLLFSPAALYVGARALADLAEPGNAATGTAATGSGAAGGALSSGLGGAEPIGRRAVAQWLPIVATTLAALLLRQPELAVTLVFATSIALLSLVMGMVGYLTPQQDAATRRVAWSFVAPAGVLCLVAGFGGALNWIHALMLLVMGLLVLWAAGERNEEQTMNFAAPTWPQMGRRSSKIGGVVQVLLALVLLALGAWGAVTGAVVSTQPARLTSAGLVGATVLAPLLVLPALAIATRVAPLRGTGVANAALVRTALLNVLVLLPVVVLGQWLLGSAAAASDAVKSPRVLQWVRYATDHVLPAATSGAATSTSLIFPLPLWRIDVAMITLLGFALLPLGAGRWKLQRAEASLLLLGYVVYLLAVLRTMGR